MSLADQFYLYNTEASHNGGWSSYFDEAATMTEQEKASFAYELDSLETTADATATFERNQQWIKRTKSSTEQLRADLEAKERANCTFTPQINAKSPRAGRGEHAGSRLHDLHTRNLSTRRARREEADEKEAEQLTFQPRLVRSAWTDNVAPRYLDPQLDTSSLAGEDDCTFQPYVNRTVTPGVERYLSIPVHERLNHRHRRSEGPSKTPTKKISKEEMDGFHERCAKAEEEKRRKLAKLKRETENAKTPPPTVLRNTNIEVDGSLMKRAQAMEIRKAKKQRQAEVEKDAACTFKPVIHKTETSKKRPANAVYQPKRLHMKELMKEKAEREEEAKRDLTFKPALSAGSRGVKGKIVPALKSAETYDLFVQQVKAVRAADVRHWKEEEDAKFHDECTFAPETSEIPAAVHAIASSLHVAGPQHVEESSYLQPLRY